MDASRMMSDFVVFIKAIVRVSLPARKESK